MEFFLLFYIDPLFRIYSQFIEDSNITITCSVSEKLFSFYDTSHFREMKGEQAISRAFRIYSD